MKSLYKLKMYDHKIWQLFMKQLKNLCDSDHD